MVLGGVAIYLFRDLRGRGQGQGEMLRLCFRAALRIPAVQKGEEADHDKGAFTSVYKGECG